MEMERERTVSPVAVLARKRAAAYRLGAMVLAALAVLTAIEFIIGRGGTAIAALFIIGFLKAGLILQYYMHVSLLWSEEGGHG